MTTPERPPSLDETGRRLFIIPAAVKGRFRRYRTAVYTLLLAVFLILPWTTVDGQQTILLDLSRRQFHFFGTVFFAHDGPLIFFITGTAAFAVILITAVFGRAWCGWACPQTVFIDMIFRRIEEWTEGSHLQRRKLLAAPWNKEKVFKKGLKWSLYLIVSSHIAHSFTAYFVGARELIWITAGSPVSNWSLFLFVQIFTLITLFNFGWFREQFCLIVCPYGRFQSVLMDRHSLAVLYDTQRGEPRRQKGMKNSGDCVDCLRCVNVCPTGIDIRNGMQMECITCTACIDACDEVMSKVGKPKGLIRYASESQITGCRRKVFTFRTFAYVAIMMILIGGLTWSVQHRPPLKVEIVRAIDAPYSLVNERTVINHFRLHITNQTASPVQLTGWLINRPEIEIVSPEIQRTIEPGEDRRIHAFVKFPTSILDAEGKNSTEWQLEFLPQSAKVIRGSLTLLGPTEKKSEN